MDESLIFYGLKSGDEKAFDLLYDLLYEPICFYAGDIIKNDTDAEDIAIHSLAKFWEKGAVNFDSFQQIKSFIFTTAKHASFNYLKSRKVHRMHHRNLVYTTTITEESIAQQNEIALYKLERLQFLIDEIERLPEQCRETFKMVVLENMSREEVAKKMNIALSTVHAHCANAKNRLRQIFSEKELGILLLLISVSIN